MVPLQQKIVLTGLIWKKQIVDERTQSKYAAMVGKGLYVTSLEAKKQLASRKQKCKTSITLLYLTVLFLTRILQLPKKILKVTTKHTNKTTN